MYNRIFLKCQIKGSFKPVPFTHGLSGFIPEKCSTCNYLFEGECTRDLKKSGYLWLDHGPCPYNGDTSPVKINNKYFDSRVYIPSKCLKCGNINFDFIFGFYCNYESEKWGNYKRELDWGNWSPDLSGNSLKIYEILTKNELPEGFMTLIIENQLKQAIDIYKKIHKNATTIEAKNVIDKIKELKES